MTDEKHLIDPDADPYWEGAAAGELRYRKCTSCSAAIFFPRSICPKCGTPEPNWVVSKGTGVVYACTTIHRAPPAFVDKAPYTVLLVDLDEGFRMMGGLVTDVDNDIDITVGDRVRVTFSTGPDGRPTPNFQPA